MSKSYFCVLADCPWDYYVWNKKGAGRCAEHHYPTMKLSDICALPVADLADKDCALFLWATFPNLPEAFEVIKAWGFTYFLKEINFMKTNREILKARIESKYAEYKNTILSYDPEGIFALSKQISATTDILDFIDIIDEEDAEYLLNFKNPLTVMSAAWEEYLENETSDDFCIMLYDLIADDEHEFDEEIRIIVENAMEQGKVCTLYKVKSMLDNLLSEYDDDRGIDSEG